MDFFVIPEQKYASLPPYMGRRIAGINIMLVNNKLVKGIGP
jgi:hypothetical protein